LRQVVNRIQVGPRPVHMFAVPETLQVWAHSDAAGTFDVISIDDADSLNATVAVRPPLPQAPITFASSRCIWLNTQQGRTVLSASELHHSTPRSPQALL